MHSGRHEVVPAGQAGQPSAKNELVNIYWIGSKLQVPARPPPNFTCSFRFDGHRCNRASRPRGERLGGVPWGHMGISDSRSVVRRWATLLTTSGHIPGHHIGHLLSSTDGVVVCSNQPIHARFRPKEPSPITDGANLAACCLIEPNDATGLHRHLAQNWVSLVIICGRNHPSLTF